MPALARLIGLGLVAGLALAGCSTTRKLDTMPPMAVPPAQSLVKTAPGSVAIRGVVETRYVNAVEQTIVLDTDAYVPGENYIKIQKFVADGRRFTQGGLEDVPLVRLDMAGEARGTVSNADMRLSPYFVRNAYGPFGYSMGVTATADLCMYAWQRIEPALRAADTIARGAINLRMQVCDRAASEQELLALMLNLRIDGATGYSFAARRALGTPGSVSAFPGDVLESRPTPMRMSSGAPAVSAPAPAAIQPATPVPSGPIVPGPDPVAPAPSVPAPATGPVPIVPLPSANAVPQQGPVDALIYDIAAWVPASNTLLPTAWAVEQGFFAPATNASPAIEMPLTVHPVIMLSELSADQNKD